MSDCGRGSGGRSSRSYSFSVSESSESSSSHCSCIYNRDRHFCCSLCDYLDCGYYGYDFESPRSRASDESYPSFDPQRDSTLVVQAMGRHFDGVCEGAFSDRHLIFEPRGEYADFRSHHRSQRHCRQRRRQQLRDFRKGDQLRCVFDKEPVDEDEGVESLPDDLRPWRLRTDMVRVRCTPIHSTCLDMRFVHPVHLDMSEIMRFRSDDEGPTAVFLRTSDGGPWLRVDTATMATTEQARCWRFRFASRERRDQFHFYKGVAPIVCPLPAAATTASSWEFRRRLPRRASPHFEHMPVDMSRRHGLDSATQMAMDVLPRTQRRRKQQWIDMPATAKHSKATLVSWKKKHAAAAAAATATAALEVSSEEEEEEEDEEEAEEEEEEEEDEEEAEEEDCGGGWCEVGPPING